MTAPFGAVPAAATAEGPVLEVENLTTRFQTKDGVINAVDGSLIHSARHPVKRPDGSRLGDAVLYSVYGGPSPDSPFTVAGEGRDASAGNTLSFLSGRLGLDSIFANGFD